MCVPLELMELLCQLKTSYGVSNAALPLSLPGPSPCFREQNILTILQALQMVKYFQREMQISGMTCFGDKGSISKACTTRSPGNHNKVSSWISINITSEMRTLYWATGKCFSHAAAKVHRKKHKGNCSACGTEARQQSKATICLQIYILSYTYVYIFKYTF